MSPHPSPLISPEQEHGLDWTGLDCYTDKTDPSITGDRVGVEPQEPCEKCFLCREGRYNLCEDVKFSGIWPYAGTIQRYKVHPAKWLYK